MMEGRKAFSLVEVTIALGVAVFALVAIFGLLPVGISSNQSAARETEAVHLATGIVEDLRQTPVGTNASSPRYNLSIDQGTAEFFVDPSGEKVPEAQAQYRVRVTLFPPASAGHKATCGSVLLSWPATSTQPRHSVTAFVALDRN